ncbi:hypothetical protein BU14_0535s0002 [Porphyra umbilicalis]|uniref:Uncharacterized protein n=1 Tax=Porphyra umbilicalis TaxID=2786 RepID=A0A1X6NS71_PORUM|nr:hypothetical protein BU14_0535s0002 [Porphyra umbilicalis]|eukprot:OSX71425.1 hypothetical protein BU14_0535s0002 [Porphyra umbilicalis]
MVPVASVEGHVNPKIFIVYKSSSGLSHMYTDRLSAHFGFCSYDWQALARDWAKYASIVVPFHTKACNNVACKSLQSVPNGKIVTIRSNGKKFLGCTGYSGSNRLGHKNDSLPTLQNWSRVETWVRVNWEVTNAPTEVSTDESCLTIRAAGSRFKCKAHTGAA